MRANPSLQSPPAHAAATRLTHALQEIALHRDGGSASRLVHLPATLLLASILLRSLLTYRGTPQLVPALAVLGVWLGAYLAEPLTTRRWPASIAGFIILQSALVLLLMTGLDLPNEDFFALLFAVLSMRVMQRVPARQGAVWIAAFSLAMSAALVRIFGVAEAIGFALIHSAVNLFMGFYALATRRADEARTKNRDLAREIERANLVLRDDAAQREQLAIARSRQHLARELHDSVTQTVFSMTLATETALLLVERDPGRVAAQLGHLNHLAQSALAQMQALINELRPAAGADIALIPALRRHLADRMLPDTLQVTLEVEGEGPLSRDEARGLFAIVREALNNVVKHARASQAHIRLHLLEPYWMEVTDDGQGFEGMLPEAHGGVGVIGMREQAGEMGWALELSSQPQAGTRVRVTRKLQAEKAE